MIKLIASDFDGTLITDDQVITEKTKSAIFEARKRGAKFVIVTGRGYMTVASRAKEISNDMPIVCLNGAYVRDEKEIYYKKTLSKEMVIKTLEIVKKYGCRFHVYNENQVISLENKFWEKFYKIWKKELGDNYKSILVTEESYESIIENYGNDVLKFLLFDTDPERLREIKAEFDNEDVQTSSSNPYNIEIFNKEASKGLALKSIAEKFNINREEIMALGDGDNDISMIEFAGIGVAMGNSFGDVQKRADYVTLSNNEEGVAEAIKRFCLE